MNYKPLARKYAELVRAKERAKDIYETAKIGDPQFENAGAYAIESISRMQGFQDALKVLGIEHRTTWVDGRERFVTVEDVTIEV